MKKFGMLLGLIIFVLVLVVCGEKKEEVKIDVFVIEKLLIGLIVYKFDDNFIVLFRKVFEVEVVVKVDIVVVIVIDF